jgi:hypothetical protein
MKFGLFPLRSPLLGESHLLYFPPGTEMVHFPGFASRPLLYSGADIPILLGISLEDSEIPGSQPVCGSPRLIAAYHVLRRLPSPRHPPYALSSLTIKFAPPEIPSGGHSMALLVLFTRRHLIVKELSDLYRRSKAQNRTLDFRYKLVEVSGFEPLTPCLQSRCSSS